MNKTAAQIVEAMLRQKEAELDRLADEVMQWRDMRGDQCRTVPMQRRGRRVRLRPKTALISEAAKRLIARDKFMGTLKKKLVEHKRVPKEEMSEAIEYIEKFFESK